MRNSKTNAPVRMLGRALLVYSAVMLGAHSSAQAETVDQAYAKALQSYYAGNYDDAVVELERVAAIPMHNEDLYYNLGCSYFRVNKLGPAIYNFERALIVAEGADDARFNLKTARAAVAAKVKDVLKGGEGGPWWHAATRILSLRGFKILFLTLWWTALAALLGLRFIAPGPGRTGLIASAALVWLLTLGCGALLAGRHYLQSSLRQEGIILPDRVVVREGPTPRTKETFKLHAGLRVSLRQEENGWIRIRLPNGLEGWIQKQSLGRL